MRRVISHQLKGEISPARQSAINGSANIALKTLEVGDLEDRLQELENQVKRKKVKKIKTITVR